MSFAPDITERLARARADLRMGVPVVFESGALVLAVETLDAERLAGVRAMGGGAIVITQHRAATLKVAAYDGDLARLDLPLDAPLAWVQAVADPADDLDQPMKGPFKAQRGGDVTAHRAAIALAKSARLLPSAIVVPIADHRLCRRERSDAPFRTGRIGHHTVAA